MAWSRVIRLDSREAAQRARNAIALAYREGGMECLIRPCSEPRLNERARRYIEVLVGLIAKEHGYERDEGRRLLKEQYWPHEMVRRVVREGGEERQILVRQPISTTNLTREQAREVIDALERHCAEYGVQIPPPPAER